MSALVALCCVSFLLHIIDFLTPLSTAAAVAAASEVWSNLATVAPSPVLTQMLSGNILKQSEFCLWIDLLTILLGGQFYLNHL